MLSASPPTTIWQRAGRAPMRCPGRMRRSSSRTMPSPPAVAPAPIASASSTITFTPAAANDDAHAQPVSPPPTITTLVSNGAAQPRKRGAAAFVNRSSQ